MYSSNWTKNIIFLIVYIISGLALVLIIDGVATGTELTPFNTTIEAAILHVRTPILTTFFVWVSKVGNPIALSVVSGVVFVALLVRKELYDALLYAVSMGIALVSLLVLKDVFHIARPDAAVIGFSGWSFPSGHATVSTAFFFAVAYTFFDWSRSHTFKILLVALSALGASLVCFSRLYLGAHWSLDILAGVALGLASVSFTALAFNIFLEEKHFIKKKVYDNI